MSAVVLPREMEAFLASVSLDKSVNTLAQHRLGLEAWVKWCKDPVQRLALDAKEVEGFVRFLSEKVGAGTQRQRLLTLQRYGDWAVRQGWLKEHGARAVVSPKLGVRLPKALSEEEMMRLLGAAVGDGPAEVRLRTLLVLLYATGLRVSELANLTLADVQEGEGLTLRVQGKGQKVRLVPLGAAGAVVEDYVKNARPHLRGSQSDWLFAGPSGKAPLTRARLWQLVKEAGLRVGLKLTHPHQLRHSFATHLLNGQADLRAVQLMLGHASLTTTQVYTKVTSDKAREALEKFHPLNRG